MNQKDLYARIMETALMYPEKVAIRHGSKTISYSELMDNADKIASFLINNHIVKESIVCVEANKSIALIACVLGILQAGGTYLLLNKHMNAERKRYIIASVEPRFIITDEEPCDSNELSLKSILESDFYSEIKVCREPNQIAYVMFTSGSTGLPKGVMVEDKNVLSYCDAYIDHFGVQSNDVMLQLSDITFDGFTEEVFVPLLSGATIVVPEKDQEKHPKFIRRLIDDNGVTLCATSPLMLNELNKGDAMPSLRVLISAGDVLKPQYFDRLIKTTNIFNMYGPTETTVCVTVHRCSELDVDTVPIGKPLNNSYVFLLDDDGKEVKLGTIGEICIGGGGVTRGYWKNEALTASKYREHAGIRIYHTGDYAYLNDNGEIVFVGRNDRQIKVRGFRVELHEIEVAACSLESIEDAAATFIQHGEEKHIVLVYTAQESIDEEKVRSALEIALPEYMIPQVVRRVEGIPENSHGKRDFEEIARIGMEYVTPRLNAEDMDDDIQKFMEILAQSGDPVQLSDEPARVWDSISFISAVVALETEYNIEFDDENLLLDKYNSIAELYKYVICKAQK